MSFAIIVREPEPESPPADRTPAAPERALIDCRALIDMFLSVEDWGKILLRLRDTESVAAAGLLMRFRFGLEHPDPVKERPALMSSVLSTPEKEEETYGDLATASGTADQIL